MGKYIGIEGCGTKMWGKVVFVIQKEPMPLAGTFPKSGSLGLTCHFFPRQMSEMHSI